ncbi:MAG: hypothetical protein GXN95_04620 [Methanococci archaeon]|nr:hypothetical protein [Methanococci archaeon]
MILNIIKLIISLMIIIFLIPCIFFIVGGIIFSVLCIGMIIYGIISSNFGEVGMGIFALVVTVFALLVVFTILSMLIDFLKD